MSNIEVAEASNLQSSTVGDPDMTKTQNAA